MGSSTPESRLEAARADLKPQHVSLVAYTYEPWHRQDISYLPYVKRYYGVTDELKSTLRLKALGWIIAYRVTVKPKAA